MILFIKCTSSVFKSILYLLNICEITTFDVSLYTCIFTKISCVMIMSYGVELKTDFRTKLPEYKPPWAPSP